jgi:hypothetical protein
MHPQVHSYLDGELPRSALSPEAAAELAEWESLEQAIAERRSESAPPGLTDGVMRAIVAHEAHADADATAGAGARARRPVVAPTANPTTTPDATRRLTSATASWRRAWEWLVTPRPIRVPPFAPIAAAAALAALLLVPMGGETPAGLTGGTDAVPADAPVVYVQFALTAAGARSVSVAGDFNDWSPDIGLLRDTNGDGVWRGLIAVKPGVHKYMFVVDGEEWVTDPVAESYVDDGFGMRNALLAVAPPMESL